jgi:hypothetical protein
VITEEFTIRPTVIVRVLPDCLQAVTAGEGESEGLIVFRDPEDARAYQETTGKHTAGEGFLLIGMDCEAIADLLGAHGLHYVHMPEPWTGGNAGVDTFTAENFVRFLEECLPT